MAVLDTSFLIALESNDPQAWTFLDAAADGGHVVPDIVAVEFISGFADPGDAQQRLESAFPIVHGTRQWIEAAAMLRRALHDTGKRFRSPEFWIAAWASHLGTSVVTRNRRHFEGLGVPVEDW